MSLFGTLGKIVGGIGGFLIGGPAGAGLGASLGGALGGAADGNKGTKQAQTANNQSVNAINHGYQSGINAGNAQFNQTAGNLAPWLISGQLANAQQGNLVGLNGGVQQQAAIDQLKASPLYTSLYGNGENAILANASATGGLRGGNTQRSLYGLGNDTLAQLIQSQLGNLGGISSMGQSTALGQGALGAANTSSIQSMLGGMGSANASGILANQGAANANNISNQNLISGLFSQGGAGFDLLGSLFGGSSGGGGSSVSSPSFDWDAIGAMSGAF